MIHDPGFPHQLFVYLIQLCNHLLESERLNQKYLPKLIIIIFLFYLHHFQESFSALCVKYLIDRLVSPKLLK